MYLPERLKSSRRLQVEIGIAGLALWYLKKDVYPKYIGRTKGEDILPPVSEYVDDSYVYAIPGKFDEKGAPQTIQVGRIIKSGYISLQGKLDEFQDFIAEDPTDDRRQLLALKKGLKLARKKMNKRIRTNKRS